MARVRWWMVLIFAGCAAPAAAVRTTGTTDAPAVEVRNYEGEVLPPYALNDAASHLEVECLDGQVYEIVDLPQDLYNASHKTTSYARVSSPDDICDRILKYRTERRTR
jgi:hypothetical protein